MLYKIYAKVREIAGINVADRFFSDRFEQPDDNDFLVCEGEGQEYIHPEFQPLDLNMLHNYKIVKNKLLETTDADKQNELALRPVPPKTEMQSVKENIEAAQEDIESTNDDVYEISEQLIQAEADLTAKSDELEETNQKLQETQAALEEQTAANETLSDYVLDLDARITSIEEISNN